MIPGHRVGWDLTALAAAVIARAGGGVVRRARAVKADPSFEQVRGLDVACRRLRDTVALFEGTTEELPLPAVDHAARRVSRVVRGLRDLDMAVRWLDAAPGRGVRGSVTRRLMSGRGAMARRAAPRLALRAHELEKVLDRLPRRPAAGDFDESPAVHLESRVRLAIDGELARRRDALLRLQARLSRGEALEGKWLKRARVGVHRWSFAEDAARVAIERPESETAVADARRLAALADRVHRLARALRVLDELHLRASDGVTRKQIGGVVAAAGADGQTAAVTLTEALRTVRVPPAPHLRRWRKVVGAATPERRGRVQRAGSALKR